MPDAPAPPRPDPPLNTPARRPPHADRGGGEPGGSELTAAEPLSPAALTGEVGGDLPGAFRLSDRVKVVRNVLPPLIVLVVGAVVVPLIKTVTETMQVVTAAQASS